MRHKTTSQPVVMAVKLSEVKAELRIHTSKSDTKLMALIAAAQVYVEDVCNLHTISRRTTLYCNSFPTRRTKIPVSPVSGIAFVKYLDSEGNLQQVDSDVYHLEDDEYEPRIYKKSDKEWPNDLGDEYERVIIEVESGYGKNASSTPASVRQAIKFLVTHWYENSVPVIVGAVPISVPLSFQSIVSSIKRHNQ